MNVIKLLRRYGFVVASFIFMTIGISSINAGYDIRGWLTLIFIIFSILYLSYFKGKT